jgi:murein DD-endopeptidase MepM/ murein hydrolase activator NlpD
MSLKPSAMIAALSALALIGCAAPASPQKQMTPDQQTVSSIPAPTAPTTPIEVSAPSRTLLPAPSPGPAPQMELEWIGPTACHGSPVQGGLLLCRTALDARVRVAGGRETKADASGHVVIGIPRDHSGPLNLSFDPPKGAAEQITIQVAARRFATQSVSGLPPATVRPPDDPALLARLARERELKNAGSASRAALDGFLQAFIWPVSGGRQSGAWGNQRVLNGDPRPPHMGLDIAAPAGTPIRAPAPGVVTLAEPDMHFDGGLVFIDHGQGVITQYLHMSQVGVKAGDQVVQGQQIGAVGATGRATGPHLCWRMRVREVQVDPGEALVGLGLARQALDAGEAPAAGVAPAGWAPATP